MTEVYEVPERTIRGLLKHEEETGSMEEKKKSGRPPALEAGGLEQMKNIINEQNDITLEEIKEKMGLSISLAAICKIVKIS